MAIWECFIDESGQFGREDEEVAVAGILVPRYSGVTSIALRDYFETHLSYVPHPPHKAHVIEPVSYVVWHEAARHHPVEWSESPKGHTCERIAEILREQGLEDALDDAVRTAPRKEGRFDFGPLYAAEQHVERQTPHLWQSLESLTDGTQVRLEACLKFMEDERPERHVALVSAEAWRGEGSRANSDRYLHQLKSLLGRLCDVFSEREEEDRIWIYPLERSIEGRGALETQHVEELIAEFDVPSNTTLEVPAAPDWSVRTDPRFALADYAANEARYRLKEHAGDSLQSVFDSIQDTVHLDLGSEQRPHVASGPSAFEALRRERHEEEPDPKRLADSIRDRAPHRSNPRSWAIEQAQCWL
jgi:hypothetical protein